MNDAIATSADQPRQVELRGSGQHNSLSNMQARLRGLSLSGDTKFG